MELDVLLPQCSNTDLFKLIPAELTAQELLEAAEVELGALRAQPLDDPRLELERVDASELLRRRLHLGGGRRHKMQPRRPDDLAAQLREEQTLDDDDDAHGLQRPAAAEKRAPEHGPKLPPTCRTRSRSSNSAQERITS